MSYWYPELEENRESLQRRFRGGGAFLTDARTGMGLRGDRGRRRHSARKRSAARHLRLPLELTRELALERGLAVDEEESPAHGRAARALAFRSCIEGEIRVTGPPTSSWVRATDVLTAILRSDFRDGTFQAKLERSPSIRKGRPGLDRGWSRTRRPARGRARRATRRGRPGATSRRGVQHRSRVRPRAVDGPLPTMANHTATHCTPGAPRPLGSMRPGRLGRARTSFGRLKHDKALTASSARRSSGP